MEIFCCCKAINNRRKCREVFNLGKLHGVIGLSKNKKKIDFIENSLRLMNSEIIFEDLAVIHVFLNLLQRRYQKLIITENVTIIIIIQLNIE